MKMVKCDKEHLPKVRRALKHYGANLQTVYDYVRIKGEWDQGCWDVLDFDLSLLADKLDAIRKTVRHAQSERRK